MTQKLFKEVVSLEANSKKEDLKGPGPSFLSHPPDVVRCDGCGKHISKLKPFNGGALLLKNRRTIRYRSETAEKAWQEAENSVQDAKDILPWLISKYGEEKAYGIYDGSEPYDVITKTYECRDCICLSDDDYFSQEKTEQIDSEEDD